MELPAEEQRLGPPSGLDGRAADLLALSLMFFFVMSALTLSLLPVVASELQSRFAVYFDKAVYHLSRGFTAQPLED